MSSYLYSKDSAHSRRNGAMRNSERDQMNAYLPPDTPATALWRSDHTPPQKPSLSDVKDKAARGPEPGTGRHPSSAFTPRSPCVRSQNFQLRPAWVYKSALCVFRVGGSVSNLTHGDIEMWCPFAQSLGFLQRVSGSPAALLRQSAHGMRQKNRVNPGEKYQNHFVSCGAEMKLIQVL